MFYGWYIVAAGVLLMAYNSSISIYGFTAFIDPIAATFGWSYAQISLATSLRGIETGALNPLMGMLVDRWPARRLAIIGMTMLGLGLLCLSQATNLATFYLSFLVMGLGGSLGVFMVPQTLVARWFKKDIGKASGVLFLGNGIGGALIPFLVIMIDTYGWQTCLIFAAVGMWIIGIPLSFVFRTRPEEYGLLPDGKPQDDVKALSSSEAPDSSKGVREALKIRAFWHMGIASTLQMGAWMALSTHLMPYLASMGIERSVGGMVAMGIPVVSLAARFPFGWLSDIFSKRYVLTVSIGLISVALFLFWLIDGTSLGLIILFVVIAGLGAGGLMPVRIPMYREYFGVKNFGKIFGLGNLFITIGVVTAPPVAGWVYDTLGVYDPIWLILSGTTALGALVMLTTPPALKNPKPAAG